MGTRLYVSNLPLSATETKLTTRFGKFGAVLSVALEAVARADRGALNLSDLDGRLVSVYLALKSVPSRP